MNTPCRSILAAALAGLAVLPLFGSGPTFWTMASAAEFFKGTSDGVYVSAEGVLSPGPLIASRLNSSPAQVWSLAEGPDGTLWAGTGGDGRLLRIRPGQGTEDVAFDADEANLFAVAVAGSRVYAASSPDGRVYVLEGNTPARPFFDPEEKYIWALHVDGSGQLWVGAGNPAAIYRVDASGTGRVVYRPPAAHVVSLAGDAEGRVLAGTESPGRLYRIGSDDRPFALLDSGLGELRAIAAGAGGVVYAAAVARGESAGSGNSETQTPTVVASATAPPTAPGTASGSRSLLFRVDGDGVWEPVWETTDVVYDLTVTGDGGVLIATGPGGRLYRMDASRDVLLLTGVDAKQITAFARSGRAAAGPVFATANPGRVLSPAQAGSPASFISTVRDTKSLATWGLIRWESAGAVTLFTRSGNTEHPDDSWSDWSGPYGNSQGEAITSPPARFIQWRAVLARTGATPARLTSVTVAYLPRNSRPVVPSLTVHPPGVVFQRPFSSEEGAIAGLDDVTADARRPPGDTPTPPTPGRRMYQKGLQTLAWKAEDADGDRLLYTVQYRREGDTTWRDLRTGLTDPLFVWDTTSVPDGRYLVRIRATDSPANSADRVLVGERESDPFEVDNTPPELEIQSRRQGAQIQLTIRVRDAHSPLQKVEYAIAGGAWQVVYPADGLADSPVETYEISVAGDTDLTRVVVRAIDVLQNVAAMPAAGR